MYATAFASITIAERPSPDPSILFIIRPTLTQGSLILAKTKRTARSIRHGRVALSFL